MEVDSHFFRISELIGKYMAGDLTAAEENELQEWLVASEDHKVWFEKTTAQEFIAEKRRHLKAVDLIGGWKELQERQKRQKQRFVITRAVKYVAMVLILLSAGLYWFVGQKENKQTILPMAQNVLPENQKVMLIMADGTSVDLKEGYTGEVQEQNGTRIGLQGNSIHYSGDKSGADALLMNKLVIPRGAEYKLILADGTIAWLNADSELTYPVNFTGNSREVQLKGEAYFDVAKDSLHPFIVRTDQFDIRVTGTQFNVRTYPNEVPSATLAEGSIQLLQDRQIVTLIPSQQASLINGKIEVKKVDLETAISWRYNIFSFTEESLEIIMNELSRWYNVSVFYQNPELQNLHFTAWFRRNSTLQEIIDVLEKTQGIKIELKGETLFITQ